MKNFCLVFLLMISFCFTQEIHSSSVSNNELIELLQFAVENGDENLLKDIVNAFLDTKKEEGYELLSAISKYNNAGKLDFAVHNAIIAHDLVPAFILAYYSKNIGTRLEAEVIWTNINGSGKSGCSREGKNPLELAFWNDMKPLIPFLISRGADIYQMRNIGFVFDGEEDLDFIREIFPNVLIMKKSCLTTKRGIVATSHAFKRNLIGDAIAKNRIDVIEMLGEKTVDWNRPCLSFKISQNHEEAYTPLQYALLMKREDIVLYLITHGAFIK